MLAFVAAHVLEDDGISVTRLVALCGQSPKSYRGEREEWNMERARKHMCNYGLTPKSILDSDESDDLFVRPTLDDLLLARFIEAFKPMCRGMRSRRGNTYQHCPVSFNHCVITRKHLTIPFFQNLHGHSALR